MSECQHEWTPHRIMGGWEQCANCGEQRDAEAPRDDPPAADRLAQTVTDAEVEAGAQAYLSEVYLPEDVTDKQHKLAVRLTRKVLDAAIRARESAPAQDGEVVVTTNETGTVCHAVTRQNEDGRILSVIWQAPASAPSQEPFAWYCTHRGKFTTESDEFSEHFIATNPDYVKMHPNHNWKPLYAHPVAAAPRAGG